MNIVRNSHAIYFRSREKAACLNQEVPGRRELSARRKAENEDEKQKRIRVFKNFYQSSDLPRMASDDCPKIFRKLEEISAFNNLFIIYFLLSASDSTVRVKPTSGVFSFRTFH